MWEKKPPFKDFSLVEVIEKVREEEGHVSIPKKAPPCVKLVMEGVFQQVPSERFTMQEIYDILGQALEQPSQ